MLWFYELPLTRDVHESAGQMVILSEHLNLKPAFIFNLGPGAGGISVGQHLAKIYAEAMTNQKIRREIQPEAYFKLDQALSFLLAQSDDPVP